MWKCTFPVLFIVSPCKVSVTKYPDKYEAGPESIKPFWISREAVAWPWCNGAASQRRHYCISMNSRSPVGLGSRQWDAVDWTCVLCDRPTHNDRESRSSNLHQYACPFYSSRVVFFFPKHCITQGCQHPYRPDLAPCDFWLSPKLKSLLEVWRLLKATVTQYPSPVKGVSLPTD
jgi:hypothetical protein